MKKIIPSSFGYKNKSLVQTMLFQLALFCCLLFVMPMNADEDGIPDKPNPQRLVNNFSKEAPDFISSQEAAQLEQKLEEFSNKTSNQIVIVIVDDIAGLEPYDYATRLGQKWGVGQGKFDNGVVVLIKPTGAAGQRKVFIAVGYGLEGAIPDLTAKRIVDNELIPNFKSGNNYEGLNKATDVLISLATGEYNSDAYGKKNQQPKAPALIFLILLVIVMAIIISKGKGGRGGGMTMSSTGWLLGSMLGGRGRGGFGGGGGSSGGFGGFGGGGFGGGGSGGSW